MRLEEVELQERVGKWVVRKEIEFGLCLVGT